MGTQLHVSWLFVDLLVVYQCAELDTRGEILGWVHWTHHYRKHLTHFAAYDIVFDGTVQGDMQVQVLLDDTEVDWSPSGSVLLGLHDLTFTPQHSVLLKILDASDGARLTINQVRVNGSTITDDKYVLVFLVLDSN